MKMKKRNFKDTKFGLQNLYMYMSIKCSLLGRICDL